MRIEKNKLAVFIILFISLIAINICAFLIKKRNADVLMKKSVMEISKIFYEEYLYEKQNDIIINAINQNNKIIIPINSMLFFIKIDNIKQLKNSKFSKCDLSNSFVEFTPYNPISKNNVDIKISLKC